MKPIFFITKQYLFVLDWVWVKFVNQLSFSGAFQWLTKSLNEKFNSIAFDCVQSKCEDSFAAQTIWSDLVNILASRMSLNCARSEKEFFFKSRPQKSSGYCPLNCKTRIPIHEQSSHSEQIERNAGILYFYGRFELTTAIYDYFNMLIAVSCSFHRWASPFYLFSPFADG